MTRRAGPGAPPPVAGAWAPPRRAGAALSRRRVLWSVAATVGASVTLDRSAAELLEPPPLWARCSFGAYAHNEPYPSVAAHLELEALVGAELGRMTWFQDMDVPWLSDRAAEAAVGGHDICISWEPRSAGTPIPFADILAGRWDDHLRSFFTHAASYPHRVVMRPFWEMNASVGAYSVDHPGPDRQVSGTAQFRACWRYLVALQRSVGGPRISWFFCVNGTDVGPTPMEEYWPGSDVVDELGLDTYNDTHSPWRSFAGKVGPMYDRLTGLDAGLPVAVGEIGCQETGAPPGQSKARWIADMFQCRDFPALRQVSFFHGEPGSPWRLDTSPEALAAHRFYLAAAAGRPDRTA